MSCPEVAAAQNRPWWMQCNAQALLGANLRESSNQAAQNWFVKLFHDYKSKCFQKAAIWRPSATLLPDVAEAQDKRNGWDHLYLVTAVVNEAKRLSEWKFRCPQKFFTPRLVLSLRLDWSRERETRRREEANEKKEWELQNADLTKASALPRQEANHSIQRRVQDMMQPLITEVRGLRISFRETGALRGRRTQAERLRSPSQQRNLATKMEAQIGGNKSKRSIQSPRRKKGKAWLNFFSLPKLFLYVNLGFRFRV